MKEQLKQGKRVTAGKAFKGGTCRLGKTVFDIVQENKEKKIELDREKDVKKKATHKLKVDAVVNIRELGKPVSALTCK